MLLAGIYSTQDGFPIKDFGNDGVDNENGGNIWVIRCFFVISSCFYAASLFIIILFGE
jgi:hypothetical protein